MAALLDREAYDRPAEAFSSMIRLKNLARDEGDETASHLCIGLFETASVLGTSELARARAVVDKLLGNDNRYRLYFDAVALLHQKKPDDALAVRERREDDSAANSQTDSQQPRNAIATRLESLPGVSP